MIDGSANSIQTSGTANGLSGPFPDANCIGYPLNSWVPCWPLPPSPSAYPFYIPVPTPVEPAARFVGGWQVVGHCHECGNPIYARASPTFVESPETRRSCNCKPD
jgi:hypothetical protein